MVKAGPDNQEIDMKIQLQARMPGDSFWLNITDAFKAAFASCGYEIREVAA